MVRTQIQLTEAQARAVRRMAAERDVSMAEVIRDAVDQLVGRPDHEARRQAAIGAIGGFRSGSHDVGSRHDEHLAGAFGE